MNILTSQKFETINPSKTTQVEYYEGLDSIIPNAWVIKPTWQSGLSDLVAVHGMNRKAKDMAESLSQSAEITGRTVVLPIFDKTSFRHYQRCVCRNRSDRALLNLVKNFRDCSIMSQQRFDLAGFSGGAQFSHRFTWFYPRLVNGLHITAPGWYTLPDGAQFPYGMSNAPKKPSFISQCLESNFKKFIDRPITVSVGSNDNIVDATTRTGTEINAQQGTNRLDRALNWVKVLTQKSIEMDVPLNLKFLKLEGCGHDFGECVKLGQLDKLFLGETTIKGLQSV